MVVALILVVCDLTVVTEYSAERIGPQNATVVMQAECYVHVIGHGPACKAVTHVVTHRSLHAVIQDLTWAKK